MPSKKASVPCISKRSPSVVSNIFELFLPFGRICIKVKLAYTLIEMLDTV